VRALGVGARGIKNDVRDARVLSEASARLDVPSVHIPKALSRERKALCTSREALVTARTQLVNTTRGFLRTQLVSIRSGGVETFPKRVRERLLARPEGIPRHIDCLLASIEKLSEEIANADDELETTAAHDETCKRLMSMPGVGPVTAVRFVAAVDDVTRFKSATKLESYLGLTPGENTTGFKERRTRITKAGPAPVRRALTQAALALKRTRPADPNVVWAKKVAERAGKHKATIALARKIARILWAMWRNGTTYNPPASKTMKAT
jgi:transposase